MRRLPRFTSLFFGLALTALWLLPAPAAAQNCSLAHVLIVLDRSSSMRHDLNNTGLEKWDVAVDAIENFLADQGDSIAFGLMPFPNTGRCTAGAVEVDMAANTTADIQAVLAEAPPTGGFWTPMAQSLDAAAAHPALQDRSLRRYVILITDGWQWCDPYFASTRFLPVDSVTGLRGLGVETFVVGFGGGVDVLTLNRSAVAGGTAFANCNPDSTDAMAGNNCYYQANDPASLNAALAMIGLQVSAEICDNIDNDCDGSTDEGLTRICNRACGTGEEQCVRGNWQDCDAPAGQPEQCDRIDNDCDGSVDEGCECIDGTVIPCGSSTGACEQGEFVCRGGNWSACEGGVNPATEVCDNADNDCDGLTDEGLGRLCQTECGVGFAACVRGSYGECDVPPAEQEICDGEDNDCDGFIDEDLVRPCVGDCGLGEQACADGRWLDCDAPQPEAEICNDDLDNNCDGFVDEGCECDNGDTRICGRAVGECSQGTQTCIANQWRLDCVGEVLATEEVCDGLDNDCDGETDEDLVEDCSNACGSGEVTCVRGFWSECPVPEAQPEICDGIDNDCDGTIDNGNDLCGAGEVCVCGNCASECSRGECGFGAVCIEGSCVVDGCPNGFLCSYATTLDGTGCIPGQRPPDPTPPPTGGNDNGGDNGGDQNAGGNGDMNGGQNGATPAPTDRPTLASSGCDCRSGQTADGNTLFFLMAVIVVGTWRRRRREPLA